MPEGPEVRILTEVLTTHILFKEIQEISFLGGRYVTHSPPKNYQEIKNSFPQKIINVCSKGKFIYLILENNFTIWITLGMSGFFTYDEYKHNDVLFKIDNKNIYFNDYRHFGTISFCTDINCLYQKLKTIGTFIMDIEFTSEKLERIIKKCKPSVVLAIFLMNQKKISGIGNYLRSEILYDCRMNPFITLGELSSMQIEELYKSIHKITFASYHAQAKVLVSEKKYSQNFKFKIYRQSKTPDGEEVKRKVISGRSIFFVDSQIEESKISEK